MKVLVIAGLPRGGTSAAASVAKGLGIPMSLPGGTQPTGEDVAHRYPHGNVEDAAFRSLVWELTGTSGEYGSGAQGDECYRHFQRRWRDNLTQGEVYELQCWFDERFDHAQRIGSGIFGVKLPTASSIIKPLAHLIIRNECEMIPFFVRRSVLDAANSLCDKRGLRIEPSCPMAWAMAVQYYNAYHLAKAQSELAKMHVPAHAIEFDSLIADPVWAATTIARRCEVPFRSDAAEMVDRSLHLATA